MAEAFLWEGLLNMERQSELFYENVEIVMGRTKAKWSSSCLKRKFFFSKITLKWLVFEYFIWIKR